MSNSRTPLAAASSVRWLLALIAVLTLVAGACGDDGDDTGGDVSTGAPEDDTTTTAGSTSDVAATVRVGETSLGDVLVDAEGRTLYLFTKDSDGESACSDGCAATWPPLIADDPTAGEGVDGTKLSTITRDDGAKQVAYDGKPLYRYAPDTKAGDVNGQGVGGVWFALKADGSAATAAAAASDTPSY